MTSDKKLELVNRIAYGAMGMPSAELYDTQAEARKPKRSIPPGPAPKPIEFPPDGLRPMVDDEGIDGVDGEVVHHTLLYPHSKN
ncbi:MAG: hypothetical protein ACKKL4_03260 [Patescibacteria group bacterium]